MVDGTVEPVRVSASVCRSSSHGSYPMAALFMESTMKTKVFLLLLAAIGCRLALCDPNAVEELQVETLVSKTSASPVTAGRSAAAGNTIASDASR